MRDEMESSKEKIEAQLCAYVEGELDDAQRAEIEQHLAANPHHQALIAELRAASGLLRDLPRATVPIELNESLCGQLERSSLLDPNDEAYGPARSVNRWPQFAAVAAVLILAAGLAFVVMYVLPPSGGNNHGQIALDDKGAKSHATVVDGQARDNNPQASTSYGREKQAELHESLDRKTSPENATPTTDVSRRMSRMAATAPAPAGSAAAGVRLRSSDQDLNVARIPTNQRGLVTAAEVENVRKWMNASLGADNTFFKAGAGNSLYLVVSTSNTAAANGQLAAYFKSNGIQYMEDETRLPALGTTALADGRDLNRDMPSRQFRMKSGVAVAEASKEAGLQKDKAAAATGAAGDISKNSSALGRGVGDGDFAKPVERGEEKKAELGVGAKASPETPAPAAPEAQAKARSDALPPAAVTPGKPVSPEVAARLDGTSVASQDADRPRAQSVQLNEALESVQPSVIVARMNRRQVNELSVALSKQQGQHAELKEFAPAVDDAIKQVTPGAAVAATGPEGGQVARAAPYNGSLTLKPDLRGGAKPAPAAAPADHVLAEKTEELVSKSPAEPKAPSLSLGTTAGIPATAPVNPTAGASAGVAAGGGEALRLSTDPLDEPVDVVIVVKKEAAPTTAPRPQIDGAP
jgi:hypothetical protein